MQFLKITLIIILSISLLSCAHSPPKNTSNVCNILKDRRSWYKGAKRAEKQWGTPVSTIMAFMNQESRFKRKAKPPRRKILWVIPGPRLSDAYGYAQAKKDTWRWYKRSSGNGGADRDNFKDAADFVAWYNYQSRKKNKIAKNDVYNLYLAYHEGHGGYAKRSYNKRPWLKKVARKVEKTAATYQKQLNSCEKSLQRKRFLFF